MLRAVLPYLIGAAVLATADLGVRWYGASQYQAGADAKQEEIRKRQAAIKRAWQEEGDRADAKHWGAVLARDAAEKTVAAQRGRIDGLLRQFTQGHAEVAAAGGRLDVVGPEWIGIIGSYVGRYEQLGKNAVRWADPENGLQGYIQAIRQR